MAKHYSPEPEAVMKRVDDFKIIHGIGPGIENRLHTAGIRTYAQLASLSPEEVVSTLGNVIGLTVKRVADQNWVGQARQKTQQKHARQHASPEANQTGMDAITPKSRQHYAVYTVELLLDEDNNVRRTRVINVQSRTEGSWAGWEEQRLMDFLSRNAALNIPTAKQTLGTGMSSSETGLTNFLQTASLEQPSIPAIGGELRLRELALKVAEAERPQKIILSDQAFSVQLTLDLTKVMLPSDWQVDYSAMIYSRKMGSGSHHQLLGKAEGKLLPREIFNVDVKNLSLQRGTYRLEAFVTLKPAGKITKSGSALMAMSESSLIQIY